jgi:hypothetical protein
MGQLKWGGKTFYPQAPKPIKSDINDLMKPLSEKVDKGNVWGSIIMNVPEETSVGPVSPTPTPSVTPTMTVTPTPTLTPTPTPSAAAVASIDYITTSANTTDASTYTFSNISIGGAGLIVISLAGDHSQVSNYLQSLTVNGVSATYQEQSNTGVLSALAYIRITGGTTATIVAGYNLSMNNCSIGIWRIQNNISDTPYQTKTINQTSTPQTWAFTSLSANTCGVISLIDGYQSNSASWTNATGNFSNTVELNKNYGASFFQSTSGDRTVSSATSGTYFKAGIGQVWR